MLAVRDSAFEPGAVECRPSGRPKGPWLVAGLVSLVPFVVCLPLWLLCSRTPPAPLAAADRLSLGCEIVGLWQIPSSVGERIVLAGGDGRLHVVGLEGDTLVQQSLGVPRDQLGSGDVRCAAYDWDGDGVDDLVVTHQQSLLEVFDEVSAPSCEQAVEPAPSAIYLQRDGKFRYLGVSHRSTTDQPVPELGPICDLQRSYSARPTQDETLLVAHGNLANGRLLHGRVLDVGDLNGDGSDDILTAACLPAEDQAKLRLYQSNGRSYRQTWTATVGLFVPDYEDAEPTPLAALADLDDDCRAELVLCQRATGVVSCFREGPADR